MRKVIGIGETILDIIFKNEQPYAAIPGGSVFNGMISLGRMGVPVLFISEVGQDHVGDTILQCMKDNALSTDYIDRFQNGKSPVSLAFLDENNNASYSFYKDYPNQRLEVPVPPINEDDIFVFGSYYSLNPLLRSKTLEILDIARQKKAIIYYDPNFRKAHANEAIHLTPTVLENLEYSDIVRGSDEDFFNLFHATDMEKVYHDHIEFYCKRFITTHGAGGVNLFTDLCKKHYDCTPVHPVSTIGAGDNFNAGIVYGLLKYDIRYSDLPSISQEKWDKIIKCGMDFANEVCMHTDNYVSKEFADSYNHY
jgi:fructokinase